MILSYRDKRTAAFANREDVPAFRGIEQQAWKRFLTSKRATEDVTRYLNDRFEGSV